MIQRSTVPDAEIAEILGMALPTVRSSAFRGLAALRRAGLDDGSRPEPDRRRRTVQRTPGLQDVSTR